MRGCSWPGRSSGRDTVRTAGQRKGPWGQGRARAGSDLELSPRCGPSGGRELSRPCPCPSAFAVSGERGVSGDSVAKFAPGWEKIEEPPRRGPLAGGGVAEPEGKVGHGRKAAQAGDGHLWSGGRLGPPGAGRAPEPGATRPLSALAWEVVSVFRVLLRGCGQPATCPGPHPSGPPAPRCVCRTLGTPARQGLPLVTGGGRLQGSGMQP